MHFSEKKTLHLLRINQIISSLFLNLFHLIYDLKLFRLCKGFLSMVQDSIIANSSLTTVYIWALKDGNLPLFLFTLYCLSIEWWYNQPNEFPPKFLLKIPTGSWGDSPAAYVAERMSLLNKFKLVHFWKMMKIYKNLEFEGIF